MCLKGGETRSQRRASSLWLGGSGPPSPHQPTARPRTVDPRSRAQRLGRLRRDKYCPLAGAVAEGPAGFLCVIFSWF